jgi:membrane dipeptidase
LPEDGEAGIFACMNPLRLAAFSAFSSRTVVRAGAALVLAATSAARLAGQSPARPYTPPDSALIRRAIRLIERSPLVDGHNDLPSQLLDRGGDLAKTDLAQPQSALQTDIPRLRAGHMGAQFWSAFVDADSVPTHAALRQGLRQIDMVHRMVAAYPRHFELARTANDITRIHHAGKIACLIGVEGGHAIENSLAALRMFYDLGVRYMTLTHFNTNDWADAATDSARHHGLTPFGKDVVREMNRLGMFVDLAHVSDATMRDAIATSVAPIIFSHSSARALSDHVRNVPDDVLRLVSRNGGVVMVNFYPLYTVPDAPAYRRLHDSAFAAIDRAVADSAARRARHAGWESGHPAPRGNVGTIADHIDYLVRVAGIDHVGLGSDFDGITVTPMGLDGVDKYPVLLAELLRRGYSDTDVQKIAGGNLLRAMHDMEAVAARLQRTTTAPAD